MSPTPIDAAPSVVAPPGPTRGCQRDALGLGRIVALGLAAVAPAYSLAVTLGYVVGAVGVQTPAAFLLGFVPILFTAFAFRDLNRAMPDCGERVRVDLACTRPHRRMVLRRLGAAGRDLHRHGRARAGRHGLPARLVRSRRRRREPHRGTVSIAIGLIALSAAIAVRGIQLAAWVQYALIALQVVAIGGFCLGRILGDGRGLCALDRRARESQLVQSVCGRRSGRAGLRRDPVPVHLWGWDALISVNEETTHRSSTPGRAVIISTVILLVLYCGASVAALGFGGVDLITSDAAIDDVLSVLGPLATGDVYGRVITLAIGLSALAALFTVAVEHAARLAEHGHLPGAAGRRSGECTPFTGRRTSPPSGGPASASPRSCCSTLVSSDFIGLAILAIGLMVAAYYAVTAIAAVVYFAPELRRGPGNSSAPASCLCSVRCS